MKAQTTTELNDQFINADDIANAIESTMLVVQGDRDSLPDMLSHTGRLLVKVSHKLKTTQLVMLVGALTIGAVLLAKRLEENYTEDAVAETVA